MKTIVSGCSWAVRNYKSTSHPELDTSWKKWDEHLSKYYNWDIINVAAKGAPNSYIINKTLDKIYNESVERCIISLSDWGSFMLPDGQGVNPAFLQWGDRVYTNTKLAKLAKQQKFFKLYPYDHKTHKQRVREVLFEIYTLIDICFHKNIELIIFQMIDSIEITKFFCSAEEYNDLTNSLLNDSYFAKIEQAIDDNKVKILGWPFVQDLGGYNMEYFLYYQNKNKELTISDADNHPNKLGHIEIANIFKEWYDEKL